jgi:antirestriction protein ArdC
MAKRDQFTRPDICSVIINCFTSHLAVGTIPWHTTWKEIPKDISGRPFHGINIWLLANLGYTRNVFLPWSQIKNLKAMVKRGEVSHQAVFWKQENGEDTLWIDRIYNISQVQGLKSQIIPPAEEIGNDMELCYKIIQNHPTMPVILEQGTSVHYSLNTDTIYLPQPEFFENDGQWFSTLFYLMVQSTGHPQRLKRASCTNKGLLDPKTYDVEDLIAEMGCSYLSSFVGIEPWFLTKYHADSEGWLQALYRDSTLALAASIYAQEAVDYILKLHQPGNLMDARLLKQSA